MASHRGVFRTFELRVLTIIDCPKIAGARAVIVVDCPNIAGAKAPVAPVLNTPLLRALEAETTIQKL